MNPVVATKAEIRAIVRASRARRPAAARDEARDALTGALTQLCSSVDANSIAAFLPTDTEPPIDGFLASAIAQGVAVLIPISQPDGSLKWTHLGPETAVIAGELGVPEPVVFDPTTLLGPEALASADVILLPAAAVDARGMRLGWGKGFYDRALAELPPSDAGVRPQTFAVVFDDEVVDELPHESHDKEVDGVVTPSGIRRF